MQKLMAGLWRWTARHPEWHPGDFGAEVACFAAQAGDTTLLIDPLLPPEAEDLLTAVEGMLVNRLAILITIPYHVRSSEELWRRYGKDAETTIHGHRACAKRLKDKAAFREIEPGVPLPGSVTAHTIGKPRRYEMPLHLPSHDAVVFGDAVAEMEGRLVMWSADKVDAKMESFYRDRFAPTLAPLLDLRFDSVLVTHGQPVLDGGKDALRKGLEAKPWYHHG
jgi:hypothetical protein